MSKARNTPESVALPANVTAVFEARYLRWLFPLISRDASPHCLSGVSVEPAESGCVLVATNGCALGSVEVTQGTVSAKSIVRVPRWILPMCRPEIGKLAAGPWAVVVDSTLRIVSAGSAGAAVELAQNLASSKVIAVVPAAVIDGTFPDWRAVITKTVPDPNAAAAFSVALISTLAQVAAEIGDSKLHIEVGGRGPAIIRAREFFGLVMPLYEDKLGEVPAFARAA